MVLIPAAVEVSLHEPAALLLSGVVVVRQVQQATSPPGAADPAERAATLASHVAAAINCGLASVLPLGAALWLRFKAQQA